MKKEMYVLRVGQKVWIQNTYRMDGWKETEITKIGTKYFSVKALDENRYKFDRMSLMLTGDHGGWLLILDLKKEEENQEYYRLRDKIRKDLFDNTYTLEELRGMEKK